MFRNIDVLAGTLIFMATFIYVMNSFIVAETNTIQIIRSSVISDAAELYANYIYSQLGDDYSKWSDKELLEELANTDIIGGDAGSYIYIGARVIEYNVQNLEGSVILVFDSYKVIAKTDNYDKAFSNVHIVTSRSKILSHDGKLVLLILNVVAYTVVTV